MKLFHNEKKKSLGVWVLGLTRVKTTLEVHQALTNVFTYHPPKMFLHR